MIVMLLYQIRRTESILPSPLPSVNLVLESSYRKMKYTISLRQSEKTKIVRLSLNASYNSSPKVTHRHPHLPMCQKRPKSPDSQLYHPQTPTVSWSTGAYP